MAEALHQHVALVGVIEPGAGEVKEEPRRRRAMAISLSKHPFLSGISTSPSPVQGMGPAEGRRPYSASSHDSTGGHQRSQSPSPLSLLEPEVKLPQGAGRAPCRGGVVDQSDKQMEWDTGAKLWNPPSAPEEDPIREPDGICCHFTASEHRDHGQTCSTCGQARSYHYVSSDDEDYKSCYTRSNTPTASSGHLSGRISFELDMGGSPTGEDGSSDAAMVDVE